MAIMEFVVYAILALAALWAGVKVALRERDDARLQIRQEPHLPQNASALGEAGSSPGAD